jgi:hypothetical protein
MEGMPALTTDHISIDVADTGMEGPVRLVWKGKGTDRHPAAVLRPYLEDALRAARERSTSMELGLEAVSYMNSSTYTCVVDLVRAARDAKVPLTLTYDRSVSWQHVGVEALRAFDAGDGLLSLRAVGDPR